MKLLILSEGQYFEVKRYESGLKMKDNTVQGHAVEMYRNALTQEETWTLPVNVMGPQGMLTIHPIIDGAKTMEDAFKRLFKTIEDVKQELERRVIPAGKIPLVN